MGEKERLKREVGELLSGELTPTSADKKIIYDKRTKQYSIKIPQDVAFAGKLNPGSVLSIVANPNKEELLKLKNSQMVIYVKEKE